MLHWKIWRAFEHSLGWTGYAAAYPGLLLVMAADWAGARKRRAKARTVKPRHNPNFVKATRVE